MLLVFILLLATSLIVITSCVLPSGPKYSQGGSKFAGDSGLPLSVDTGEENLFHTTGQLLQQANVCEGKPEKIQHKVVMGIKLSLCAYTRMPLNLSAKVNHPYLLPLPKYMKGGKLNYFLQHANCTFGTHLYAFPLSSRIKSLLPLQIEIRSFSKTATKLNLKSKVISTHSKSKVSTYFAFAFGAFN